VSKLPAPEAGARLSAKGRLEAWAETNSKEMRRGTRARPRRTVQADEHQGSELSRVVPVKVGNSPPEDPLEGR
jgi:hypothetical protein